jgi:hypothetical protein
MYKADLLGRRNTIYSEYRICMSSLSHNKTSSLQVQHLLDIVLIVTAAQ